MRIEHYDLPESRIQNRPVFMNWDEKRKQPRFRASENALAASGDDPYTLMDLSAGGVGIRFCGDQPLPNEIDKGQAGQMPEWHVGLQFEDPGPEMLKLLRHFRL